MVSLINCIERKKIIRKEIFFFTVCCLWFTWFINIIRIIRLFLVRKCIIILRRGGGGGSVSYYEEGGGGSVSYYEEG